VAFLCAGLNSSSKALSDLNLALFFLLAHAKVTESMPT